MLAETKKKHSEPVKANFFYLLTFFILTQESIFLEVGGVVGGVMHL